MEKWVRTAYHDHFCDWYRQPIGKVDLELLRTILHEQRPNETQGIDDGLKKLNLEICTHLCKDVERDAQGRFRDPSHAHALLANARTDLLNKTLRKKVVKELQEQGTLAHQEIKSTVSSTSIYPEAKADTLPAAHQETTSTVSSTPIYPQDKADILSPTHQVPGPTMENELQQWIHQLYHDKGFVNQGFIGWKSFAQLLTQKNPDREKEIKKTLQDLRRRPGHAFYLKDPNLVQKDRSHKSYPKAGAQPSIDVKEVQQVAKETQQVVKNPQQVVLKATPTPTPNTKSQPSDSAQTFPPLSGMPFTFSLENAKPIAPPTRVKGVQSQKDAAFVARQLRDLQLSEQSLSPSAADSGSESSPEDMVADQLNGMTTKPDFSLMDQLISQKSVATGMSQDIENAPLLSGDIVSAHVEDLVPQYGFLGSYTEGADAPYTKIFQNTNVPFSTFICGVQGSGKSHTTAVMLENALLSSPYLGYLKAPVSALVFNYGEFSNGGLGFNISEVAFLAAANKSFPGHRVKKITVLTSPSNPAINRIYARLPNVEVIPFKLKAKALDIGPLMALMAVNEKSEVPLYMARVESILRAIATETKEGVFDYDLFKKRLAMENFDPKQTNMLEMRLGLLESFLDKTGKAPEPQFRQGEITIIDLSDPFVTPHTACILFKLCLERYMQSPTPGKMVVLDEAHKYMLDNPGSKSLTAYLATLVRLQRHKGARVVISTQEPTVSTDLIALCSVTIVHRFTSPTWYAALKKHISAMDDDKAIMQQIECLKTGEALIYSPNTALGKNDDGNIRKATGRLLKVNIRMRVTRDGGESVMAI